jgi:hypothetical protein
MGQGPDWTALAAFVQAKQREMTERASAAPERRDTTVAAVSESEASQTGVQTGPDQGRSAQIALQAHIQFKAQGGDEAGLKEPQTSEKKSSGPSTLSEDEQRVVDELKARDAEVRRHEQAHAAVGGGYASAPSYVYQVGPDGRRYAVGGSVEIDMSPVPGDPEATIAKMDVVRRAAMAPAEPSSTDRSVAAAAQAAQAQALAELNADRIEAFGSSLDLRA